VRLGKDHAIVTIPVIQKIIISILKLM